jgi:beta propeller repeat protein
MKSRAFAGLALVVILSCGAGAAIINVPSKDYLTIQAGIDAAVNGDTVKVASGRYAECINFNGKNITVTSADPNSSSVVASTIIDAQGKGSAVSFKGTEGLTATLAGFTITRGTGTTENYTYTGSGLIEYVTYHRGGGIYCPGSATITRNVIISNTLPMETYTYTTSGSTTTYYVDISYGGGIYASGATITYNLIYRNTAYVGGGVYGGGIVADNLIYDNSAYEGGGIYYYNYGSSAGRLTNNTVVNNDASLSSDSEGRGGNMYAEFYGASQSVIANNIFCNAKSGGGLFWYVYGSTSSTGTLTDLGTGVRNNDVFGNVPADYIAEDSSTGTVFTGSKAELTGMYGNISVDPLLQTVSGKRYRLSSDSPCISAGDPAFTPFSSRETDIDGDARVYALRVDIGADEYIGYVKPIADAGPDIHVATPVSITLDGSGSYVLDPSAGVSYQWTQIDGPAASLSDPGAAVTTFTPSEEGAYVFQLVVLDTQEASNPDEILVLVGNHEPMANAGPDRLCAAPGNVQLDGSKSSDGDSIDKLTYFWMQTEGPGVVLSNAASANPWFYCTQVGTYRFQLVVSDGLVDSAPDEVKIETATFVLNATDTPVVARTSSSDASYYFHVDISGTAVAYAGSETTSSPSSWMIYRRDFQSKEVVKYEGGSIDTRPKIDGDITVWTGATSGTYSSPLCTNLYAASTMAGNTVVKLEVATNTVSYGSPAIAGNTIVYLRHTDVNTADTSAYAMSSYDICGIDISDFAHPVHFTIAEQAGHGLPYDYSRYYYDANNFVDISGHTVVWEADGDIWGADLSDVTNIRTFPICTAPERQSCPAISGHWVVWKDQRNDAGDIYGADISDPNNVREFEICVESGEQLYPCVDGSLAAWVDGSYSGGTLQICALSDRYGVVSLDLSRFGSWYGNSPSLHGTTLAYRDNDYHVSALCLSFSCTSPTGAIQNVTKGTRYESIQYAVTAASDGDVIEVPPGVYDERIRVGGKNVTITSTDPNDPAVRAATVLKGDGQLISFIDGETSACVFTGFTVTGGSVGVYLMGSSPTIRACDVTGNRDAGMKLYGFMQPLMKSCNVTGNGTGIEMIERIARTESDPQPVIQNCLIAGSRGYGVYGGDPTITNCTIADNGKLGVFGYAPVIKNSIVYFNADSNSVKGRTSLTVRFSDIQGGAAGQGNINLDPCFQQRGSWINSSGQAVLPAAAGSDSTWTNGDYHLASRGWRWSPAQQTWVSDDKTSPCIDAGDPSLPIGDERPCGQGDPLAERAGPNTRIDMGLYGGTAEASLAPKAGL